LNRRIAAVGRRWGAGQRIPLRAYVAGLVVLFVAVAGVSIVYQRLASLCRSAGVGSRARG
jgi:hypothetical protein